MYNLTKLKSIFSKLTYTCSKEKAFTEILDFLLVPFQYFDTNEELTSHHQFLTTHKHKSLITEFFVELGELNEGFKDPLGEFFMSEISHGHMGQYFTPEPICDMMAMMTNSELENGQTILDPACGSGRFLLSAAKMNRNAMFFGADLDPNCCKMALLNLLLNSLTGEIAHMDSLSNLFYTSFMTGTIIIDGFHRPYYKVNTDPEQSRITLKIVKEALTKNVYVQGDLFK